MQIKNELIACCRKVYEKKFVAGTDGNVSVKLPDKTILVTASGVCKGEVTADDLVHSDMNGKGLFTTRKVSTEFKMHLHIYKARPEINAVVHCHPLYASAFACSGRTMDVPVFPEVILGLGRIPLCPYATPSTGEVLHSLEPFLSYVNVFLLENHGAVAIGTSLKEAYFRMEKLEHTAQMLHHAAGLGGARQLSREQLDKLYALAEPVYGLNLDRRNRY
jgi:L-fuculose-phosphate aldolase